MISCAADGTVRLNSTSSRGGINSSTSPERILHNIGPHFVHKTLFDVQNANVLYIADDLGDVSRTDLREYSHSSSEKVYSRISPDEETLSDRPASAKALAQHAMSSNYLLVGGHGFAIDLIDLRMPRSSIVKVATYDPTVPVFLDEQTSCTSRSKPRRFSDVVSAVDFGRGAYASADVSVSGLQYSKDGKTILASYQGDQIYLFDALHRDCQNVEKPFARGARSCLGGHLNSKTFLKVVFSIGAILY